MQQIVIEHATDELFFSGDKAAWVSDPGGALHFASIIEALKFAQTKGVRHAHVVSIDAGRNPFIVPVLSSAPSSSSIDSRIHSRCRPAPASGDHASN